MKEKTGSWLGNNWFKVISALVLLMIGFSVFYYFFLRSYQNDKPYRECMNQIDPNANFKDIVQLYSACVELFR